jgi:hypothetical protein
MKASNLILAASLTVNAALVALVAINAPGLFRLGQPAPTTAYQARVTRPAAQPDSPDGNLGARSWTALKGDDLKTLVARLRAAGFPPGVIRAIVKAQLDEQLHARSARRLWTRWVHGPTGARDYGVLRHQDR